MFYQVLHAGECGSRDIEAVKRIEGEAQPPQHQRVYGVAMPPPPSSSSSNKMDAINEMDTTPIAMEKEDASLPPSSSPPRRVYGVAMPPTIPKEQSIDAMEEEEGVVPVKSKKMYGPAMPPPSMQNTTGIDNGSVRDSFSAFNNFHLTWNCNECQWIRGSFLQSVIIQKHISALN